MELLEGVDDDPLSSLEERIQKAVLLIPRLREDKEAALREKDEAVRESLKIRDRLAELTAEVETLRREREQVRARIEKLLSHMDVIGAS